MELNSTSSISYKAQYQIMDKSDVATTTECHVYPWTTLMGTTYLTEDECVKNEGVDGCGQPCEKYNIILDKIEQKKMKISSNNLLFGHDRGWFVSCSTTLSYTS